MATTIRPIASNAAGEATNIAVQAFSDSEVLTACRNGSGDLELIGWHTGGNSVTRAADSTGQAGAVSEVALSLFGRRAVTAVRDGSGQLLLVSWEVPQQLGSIQRLADSRGQAGVADLIAIAPLTESLLVTAMRSGNGKLLLISWELQQDGTFKRLGDSGSQAGAVSDIALVAFASPRNTIVTAVRNGSGILELILWNLSPDGSRLVREGDSGAQAGAISEIAMVHAYADPDSLQPGVVTAVRNGSGILELIAWRGVERIGDSGVQAGAASHIAINVTGSPTTYATSMRRGSGDLEVIAFDVAARGEVTRTADFGQSEGTDVTETAIASLRGGRIVTALRRANFLHVITWEVSSVQ
jgi:hypothetical protein